ncbi:Polygalacturonase [Nymphaea thermarum]|nr:Polygalacturonase [Nymphaea thermarum]
MVAVSVRSFRLLLLFSSLLLLSSFHGCAAYRSHRWKHKKPTPATSLGKKKGKSGSNGSGKKHISPIAPAPEHSPPPAGSPPHDSGVIFDVIDFGAKGDGVTDDTKAFEEAWAAACKVEASTVAVPSYFEFVVGPISFSGPYCEPNILDGTILAPASAKPWGSGLLWWIEFTKLRGLTIRGHGVIDGRGAAWWGGAESYDPTKPWKLKDLCVFFLHHQALRFYGSTNVTVTGITIRNSPQCHLKFDSCMTVSVYNMTVSSPGNSPNTDGIHLQNSVDVVVHHSNLACGDDCVSIQTGCSNIRIHDINCGPGHGISIGGLGRDNTKACVSNITVRDVVMQSTMTAVRIKTWQGGAGSVQDVLFSNIQVSEVQFPIVIDQFYCDRSSCRNQTSAVALSGITYERIRGTYTVKPVHFACSDEVPCTDVILNRISLEPIQETYHMYQPYCWQVFGDLQTPTEPPIDCLMVGKPAKAHTQSDRDAC